MELKNKADLTDEEKEWLDAIVINYVIAQSDGFQLGYARAINDFTEYIISYWNGSDDKPQQSILDALVDLGEELHKLKYIAEKNLDEAQERGYINHYNWNLKKSNYPLPVTCPIYTKVKKEDADV